MKSSTLTEALNKKIHLCNSENVKQFFGMTFRLHLQAGPLIRHSGRAFDKAFKAFFVYSPLFFDALNKCMYVCMYVCKDK